MILVFIVAALVNCEGFLIGEDPYQFEHLTTEQLVRVYWLNKNQNFHSNALLNEIQKRMKGGELSHEEREILSKTLANERGRSE